MNCRSDMNNRISKWKISLAILLSQALVCSVLGIWLNVNEKLKVFSPLFVLNFFMRTTCTLSTCLSINYYKNLYSYLNISYTILERIVEWTTQKSITDRKDISDSEQRG